VFEIAQQNLLRRKLLQPFRLLIIASTLRLVESKRKQTNTTNTNNPTTMSAAASACGAARPAFRVRSSAGRAGDSAKTNNKIHAATTKPSSLYLGAARGRSTYAARAITVESADAGAAAATQDPLMLRCIRGEDIERPPIWCETAPVQVAHPSKKPTSYRHQKYRVVNFWIKRIAVVVVAVGVYRCAVQTPHTQESAHSQVTISKQRNRRDAFALSLSLSPMFLPKASK
jgi:hypothetical protein